MQVVDDKVEPGLTGEATKAWQHLQHHPKCSKSKHSDIKSGNVDTQPLAAVDRCRHHGGPLCTVAAQFVQSRLVTLCDTALSLSHWHTTHLLRPLAGLEHHQVVSQQVVLCVLAPCRLCQPLELCLCCPAVLQPAGTT
jgi:hypothetical protein